MLCRREADYTATVDLANPAAIATASGVENTLSTAAQTSSFSALDNALPTSQSSGFTGASAVSTVKAAVAVVVTASSEAALNEAAQEVSEDLPSQGQLNTGLSSTLGTTITVTNVEFIVVDNSQNVAPGDDDSESSGLSGGAIAGIVIGAIAGVVLIGLGVWWVSAKKTAALGGEDFSTKTTQRV